MELVQILFYCGVFLFRMLFTLGNPVVEEYYKDIYVVSKEFYNKKCIAKRLDSLIVCQLGIRSFVGTIMPQAVAALLSI